MTGTSGHHDPLAALAERTCTAAGTTLDAVLADLHTGTPDPTTPPAIRAGWEALDTPIPHTTTEQP